MGTDRLFLEYRTGAQPRVLQYVNSTFAQLGNLFGTTYESASSVIQRKESHRNRAVHFCGEVYAVLFDGVYRLNQGPTNFPSGAVPNDWSNLAQDGGLVFTSPPTGDDRLTLSGLYVANVLGVPHLCGVRADTVAGINHFRGHKLNSSTGLWSETAAVDLSPVTNQGNRGGITNGIVFRNTLHFAVTPNVINDVLKMNTYDPATDGFSNILYTGVGQDQTTWTHDFCVFQDRLFFLASTSQPRLWEFTGGTWAFVVGDSSKDQGFITTEEARNGLFTDGTNMFGLYLADDGPGWTAWQWDSALAMTDISSTVLPVGLLSGRTSAERFEVFTDFDTNPTSPTFLLQLMAATTPGTARVSYQWNGNAALITQVDTGGDLAHAGPNDDRSGGERFFTVGQLGAKITSRKGVFGGEEITFRAFGDPVVLLHGAVTGGPFQEGEIITGGTSGATGTVIENGVFSGALKLGLVTGTFQNAELLTGGTSTATATTTAGPTGGAATRNMKLFFSVDGEPTLVQAQLATPVTGGSATYNVGLNQVENIAADHLTDYTIVWDIDGQAPAVAAGDRVTRYAEVFV